jgi:hypothetical protein
MYVILGSLYDRPAYQEQTGHQLIRSAAQIRPMIHALTNLPVMFMGINMLPNKKLGRVLTTWMVPEA